MRRYLKRCGCLVPSKFSPICSLTSTSQALQCSVVSVNLNASPFILSDLTQALSHAHNYASLLDAPLCSLSPLHRWGLSGYGRSQETPRLDVVHRQVYHQGVPQGAWIDTEDEFQGYLQAWLDAHTIPFDNGSLPEELPTTSGIFGFLSYESVWLASDKLASLCEMPATIQPTHRWVAYPHRLVLDYKQGRLYFFSASEAEHQRFQQILNSLQEKPQTDTPLLFKPFQDDWLKDYTPSLTQASFEAQVKHIQDWIASGDLYQANLSIQWQRHLRQVNPWVLFRALMQRNPSPFSGLWKSPQGWILSNSPERLVKQDGDTLSTRPIAGTRSRGQSQADEVALEAELLSLEKERAEHLMLVDLERNDLGKVCRAGSVHVDELMSIERYSHVTHVVSNIVGEKREDVSQWEVLNAIFPGGTITGCPKLRCIEKLASCEQVARNAYTGSFGYLDPHRQSMDFNILIRTLSLTPRNPLNFEKGDVSSHAYDVTLQAGAGIVQDSVPTHEWKESLKKAKAVFEVLHALS